MSSRRGASGLVPFQLFVLPFSLYAISVLATRLVTQIGPFDPSIFLRVDFGGLSRAVSLPLDSLGALSLSMGRTTYQVGTALGLPDEFPDGGIHKVG
jgi:hypothetical protein